MSGWTFHDANGNILSAASGGLTSPVGIADGGTGQTTQTPAFNALSPLTTQGDIIYHNGTNNVRLAAGSNGQVLGLAGGVPAWGNRLDVIVIKDEKTSGTSGGTFTSGAWQTRDLNTEATDTGNYASIASNQITLAAGTYLARIRCPAYEVARHQARLQNITDTLTVLTGSSEYNGAADAVTNASIIVGVFTLAASKVLEVQHQCSSTKATSGFGQPGSFGTEVFTTVELLRIGD